MKSARLILGNQLFPLETLDSATDVPVLMAEDRGLCTHYKYHKHKIVLFLAAMRAYADELRVSGRQVLYTKIDEADCTFEMKLDRYHDLLHFNQLRCFEIEDKFMEERIKKWCADSAVSLRIETSPMFLTSRAEFSEYLGKSKKPLMADFYQRQRRRLAVMIDGRGQPVGGRWSFDTDNRKKLPSSLLVTRPRVVQNHSEVAEVQRLCEQLFHDHPGQAETFCYPVDRQGALAWLDEFLDRRFKLFGAYEDAIDSNHDFLFHSFLSPAMNLGLLTPREIIGKALSAAADCDIPLNSLEGFVRQVIGWREFVRGIYQRYSDQQEVGNFFGHHRRLSQSWYVGDTGVPPLDDAIDKVKRLGWLHHIERLMTVANIMNLCGVMPSEAHRWFMEMFIDSSDWVMGPNVFGMGLMSDGGIFTTKPYLCGSNYILKMSHYKKGPWCDGLDGLYWGFIDRHRAYFTSQPRMGIVVTALDKLDPARATVIATAGEMLRDRLTMD